MCSVERAGPDGACTQQATACGLHPWPPRLSMEGESSGTRGCAFTVGRRRLKGSTASALIFQAQARKRALGARGTGMSCLARQYYDACTVRVLRDPHEVPSSFVTLQTLCMSCTGT